MDQRAARCSCGSLWVQTVGEPLIVITCFCEECQRRTGSPVSMIIYTRSTG
jgi:hypothetical protein